MENQQIEQPIESEFSDWQVVPEAFSPSLPEPLIRATNTSSRANSSYPSFFPDVLMKYISCIYPPPSDSRKQRFIGIPY